MRIGEITSYLESIAPLEYQEGYDNSGLIVGRKDDEVSKVLVSLDCTEEVVQEAINKKCELIIAHHPIVFGGLKKFNGTDYVQRTVMLAIKNDIGIYAIHTNLDNVLPGVNAEIARRLGLQNVEILAPKKELLSKLVTFVPNAHLEEVRSSLFEAGAGSIGGYSDCSFSTDGEGTFKAGEDAQPFVGEKGKLHREKESRLELIVPRRHEGKIVQALLHSHPYEEVAYDLYPLRNANKEVGAGMVGDLENPTDAMTFLRDVKDKMKTPLIRYTRPTKEKVQRIAICGGAGSFLLPAAKGAKADVFITGDYKYHQFFDAEEDLMIADIGHYESEQFTKVLIKELLMQNFAKFAVLLSEVNTNPINYL